MNNIELQIDKISLEGINSRDRGRVAAALETELARLFAETGIPDGLTRGGDLRELNVGSLSRNCGDNPDRIGAAAAR